MSYDSENWLWRGALLKAIFVVAALVLAGRAVDLQLLRKETLQEHGDARYLRVVTVPAHRGKVSDRNGEPLAVSTPVSSVWANPSVLIGQASRWADLEKLLAMEPGQLKKTIEPRRSREFVYLKRHIDPELAEQVMDLDIEGVSLQSEFRRYYPTAEVVAHVIGFTNVDDVGQEGIELAMNEQLKGEPGAKRVIKDRLGRIVENVEGIKEAYDGKDLSLSIDRRIQYVAYRELKKAVEKHKARSGSVVVLDSQTGEILAMVNQPSYNPNNRSGLKGEYYRNRVVTDLFEPGSTMKPFTIAAALESGAYTPATVVETAPGYYKVGRNTVRDVHNYGTLDVSGVIRKSSNVGASKIALSMEPEVLWSMFSRLGFGQSTRSGFPGEVVGRLNSYRDWHEIEQATLAFGYGLSVTSLQLAQAYQVLASDGLKRQITLLPGSNGFTEQVMSVITARQVRTMLESVVEEGTGKRAQVKGYRVAGKTGTVHKSDVGGYAEDRYLAVFAGMAPASHPRLVTVVMINEPRGGDYYGGVVAAPVFAAVMRDSLRLLDIAPDDLESLGAPRLAQQSGGVL